MISKLSFNDFRMFAGNHEIDFSPITIFTGPNNSGKSSLIKLTKKLVDYSNLLWLHEPDIKDFLYDYNIVNSKIEVGINNLSLRYTHIAKPDPSAYYSKSPDSVHFSEAGTLIASIHPLGMVYQYEDYDDVFECLIIHMDNITKLDSKWYYGYFKKESDEFRKNLKVVMKNSWPRSLFETKLNNEFNKYPIFHPGYDNETDIQILLPKNKRPYGYVGDSYLSFLFCYSLDLIDSINRNQTLTKDFKTLFINVLEYIFRFFILAELETIKSMHDNNIFYSAYRGAFIYESDSQANQSFRMLNEKMPSLISPIKKKGFKRLGGLINKDDAELLNKWLKMFEIGDDLFVDVKQLNTFKISIKEGLKRYPFELGFGNQQLLPLIMGVISNPSSLFFVEEPESHLHPYLQSMLADFFVDAIKSRRYMPSQFVIETHSEYFIRKLQYLVAKKKIDPKEISLYYIHKKNSIPDITNQVQKMEFNKDGSLNQGFGPGFFDEADNLAIDLFNLKKINKN